MCNHSVWLLNCNDLVCAAWVDTTSIAIIYSIRTVL